MVGRLKAAAKRFGSDIGIFKVQQRGSEANPAGRRLLFMWGYWGEPAFRRRREAGVAPGVRQRHAGAPASAASGTPAPESAEVMPSSGRGREGRGEIFALESFPVGRPGPTRSLDADVDLHPSERVAPPTHPQEGASVMSSSDGMAKRHYEPPAITSVMSPSAGLVCVLPMDQVRALKREIAAHGEACVSATTDFLVMAGDDGHRIAAERASQPAPHGAVYRGQRGHIEFVATVIFMGVEADGPSSEGP